MFTTHLHDASPQNLGCHLLCCDHECYLCFVVFHAQNLALIPGVLMHG